MTTLVLIRHAKSDWGSPSLDDHDRPLNARGLRDAPVLARRLAAALEASGTVPGAVLSSTALRARTTAQFFGAAVGLEPELDPDLYGAPASRLLSAAAERGVDTVIVVAHDPGMTVLAERLSDGGIGHMPTCAVATFQWRTPDWDVATATAPDAWDFDFPGSGVTVLAVLAGRIVPASCVVPVDPCLDGGPVDLTGPLIGLGLIVAAVVAIVTAVVLDRRRRRRDWS